MKSLTFMQGRLDGAAGAGKTPDPDDQSDYARGWREGKRVTQHERENQVPKTHFIPLLTDTALYFNWW